MEHSTNFRRTRTLTLGCLLALAVSGCAGLPFASGDEPETTTAPTPPAAPTGTVEPPSTEPQPQPTEAAASTTQDETDETSEVSSGNGDQGQETLSRGRVELDLEQRHPNGVILRLKAIEVAETTIAVEIEAVNGFRDEVSLATSPFTGLELIDDTGVDYKWVRPDDNDSLRIQPGGTLTGRMVFTGQLPDEARSLTFRSNDGLAGNPQRDSTIFPSFQFDDIALDGSGAAAADTNQGSDQESGVDTEGEVAAEATESAADEQDDAPEEDEGADENAAPEVVRTELDLEQRHPNGVILRLTAIEVADTTIAVEIEAVNGFRDEVTLATSPFTGLELIDDTGVDYKWVRPDDNDSLRIQPGGTLTGRMVFTGQLPDEARSLTFRSNDGLAGNPQRDSTIFPSFQFDDIPVGR